MWLSSQNAVLVESRIGDQIVHGATWQVRCEPVNRRWRQGVPWSGTGIPSLCQLMAVQPISAAAASVEFEGCECGAVRRLSFKPLIVMAPDAVTAGVWFLRENPAVLVIGDKLRALLSRHDASLEFGRAYYEGEYVPPSGTFEGVRWDDIG